MANSVGNWAGEVTTTTGTGDITLGGAIEGYSRFEDAGETSMYYVIKDGVNREVGLGTFSAPNTLERTAIEATLIDGVYDGAPSAGINLSGTATVYSSLSKSAFDSFVAAFNKLSSVNDGETVPVNIGDLYDVDTTGKANLKILVFNADGDMMVGDAVPREINAMSDVDTSGKVEGRILEFDSSGNMVVGDKSTPTLRPQGEAVHWSDQSPSAADAPQNVLFGDAQASTRASLGADGVLTYTVSGTYPIEFELNAVSRGASGDAYLVFIYYVDDVQVGLPITVPLVDGVDAQLVYINKEVVAVENTTVKLQMHRDSKGNNEGGLEVNTLGLGGSSPSAILRQTGFTPNDVPLPPAGPAITDWQTDPGSGGGGTVTGVYTFDVPSQKWMTNIDGVTTNYGLAPLNGWEVGFRRNFLDITFDVGVDINFGFPNTDFTLYDSAGTSMGTVGWSTGYNLSDQLATIAISNAGNLDYSRLFIETFLYNESPQIKALEFRDS